MSKDINNMERSFQKVIEVGEIDRWLRDMLPMMPRTSSDSIQQEREMHTAGYEVTHHDFNTHTITLSEANLIDQTDIERMVGFGKLLAACSQVDMRVDVSLLHHGALEVAFNPEESFARSQIFGASYSNVVPVVFGLKNPRK